MVIYFNLCFVFFEECIPGYWGSNCSNTCSCTESETCDPENGICSENNGENNSEYYNNDLQYNTCLTEEGAVTVGKSFQG